MPLPNGVATFTVTFGVASVLGIDEDLAMRVTFQAATSVVHAASGRPFLHKAQTVDVGVGESGVAVLVSPDQDGFEDGLGNTIRNWTYLAHIEYVDTDGTTIASADRPFTWLTTMPSVIDLDLLVPVTSSAGVVVNIPTGGGYDGGTVYDNSSSTSASVGSALVGSATI